MIILYRVHQDQIASGTVEKVARDLFPANTYSWHQVWTVLNIATIYTVPDFLLRPAAKCAFDIDNGCRVEIDISPRSESEALDSGSRGWMNRHSRNPKDFVNLFLKHILAAFTMWLT